jgi:hypothetical protein
MNTPEVPAPVELAPTPTLATVVVASTPSSQNVTQQPEDQAPQPTFTVEEAVRVVVDLVSAHRTVGDPDLAEAIAVLDAEYPAPEVETPAEDASEDSEERDAQAERARQWDAGTKVPTNPFAPPAPPAQA